MSQLHFQRRIEILLRKYEQSTLGHRWSEAISFGSGADASAFWIRDSEEVVNIVWLNPDGIRDVTLLSDGESMFNFVPLSSVTTFEVRQGQDIASEFGLGVSGQMVIHVVLPSPRGHIYWVAETDDDVAQLDGFFTAVMEAYLAVQ